MIMNNLIAVDVDDDDIVVAHHCIQIFNKDSLFKSIPLPTI